ncbi:TonB-dependent receptor plug domain-containing protein [Sphingobium yanoikuyae]|uniref:STN domain-containing protein n=2 Tax=Sphingobium yanoikuyae TaxID=13690 RepID=UPI003938B918
MGRRADGDKRHRFGRSCRACIRARRPAELRHSHAVAARRLDDLRSAVRVTGSLPPLQALSQLLSGTGLSFRVVGSTVTRRKPRARPSNSARSEWPENAVRQALSVSLRSLKRRRERVPTPSAPQHPRSNCHSRCAPPQSVSVVTRQQIEDQNLQSIATILVQTPGIAINRDNSEGYSFYSRGGRGGRCRASSLTACPACRARGEICAITAR